MSLRCSGSGSVSFWASWTHIRNCLYVSDPDLSINKQKYRKTFVSIALRFPYDLLSCYLSLKSVITNKQENFETSHIFCWHLESHRTKDQDPNPDNTVDPYQISRFRIIAVNLFRFIFFYSWLLPCTVSTCNTPSLYYSFELGPSVKPA